MALPYLFNAMDISSSMLRSGQVRYFLCFILPISTAEVFGIFPLALAFLDTMCKKCIHLKGWREFVFRIFLGSFMIIGIIAAYSLFHEIAFYAGFYQNNLFLTIEYVIAAAFIALSYFIYRPEPTSMPHNRLGNDDTYQIPAYNSRPSTASSLRTTTMDLEAKMRDLDDMAMSSSVNQKSAGSGSPGGSSSRTGSAYSKTASQESMSSSVWGTSFSVGAIGAISSSVLPKFAHAGSKSSLGSKAGSTESLSCRKGLGWRPREILSAESSARPRDPACREFVTSRSLEFPGKGSSSTKIEKYAASSKGMLMSSSGTWGTREFGGVSGSTLEALIETREDGTDSRSTVGKVCSDGSSTKQKSITPQVIGKQGEDGFALRRRPSGGEDDPVSLAETTASSNLEKPGEDERRTTSL
eukprot:gnl/MRDRNA2_/MRDRNA2_295122_c0_seq1.p1 gnl/MRDRNA2_/MRDRNA2_295122_c0~~gnl/MRDRNA2_/MRDRNA2_295122_c0_seq1.p1  ORF type:complete len:434 (+),score=32.04 gnl/MRDRNA2_/MRDRNA2_295122_c0_seq1:69-1304(+)